MISREQRIGFLYLFLGIFTWATIELTVKLIQSHGSPITFNLMRMLFGGIVLFGFIIATGEMHSFKYFLKTYPKYYIPAAVLGLVLGQIVYLYGVTLTQASTAATIFSANPILISAFMIGFMREKLTKYKIAGVLLGFLGVIIVITQFQFQGLLDESSLVGNVLVFLGMGLWCSHVIIGKILFNKPRTAANTPPVTSMDYNAVTFLVTAIFMLPFLLLPNEYDALRSFTWQTWVGVLYLGLITGGLGYVLFFKGLKLMEASKGINIFYFKPIIATVLSLILLQEVPSAYLYLGIAIEIVALLLVSKEEKHK